MYEKQSKAMDVKPYLQTLVLAVACIALSALCLSQTPMANDRERQIAKSAEQQGEFAEAEAAWLAYSKSHPDSAEAYAHLGFLKARQQRYTEAIDLYRRAMALNPEMPGLQMNFGLSLLKSGALPQAIKTFTVLLEKQSPSSPDRQRLNVLIGMANYSLGNYGAAVPYLKDATSHDRQSLELRLVLAHSCLGSKDFQCVLDVYKEIVILNPDSAEADMLAGEALDEMKDSDGAVLQFRAAVKANPNLPRVHFGLGYLLWKLERYPEAALQFEAELANDQNDNLSRCYLGDIKLRTQDPTVALSLLESASSGDPDLELAHLDLGVLYSEAGRQDDALQQLLIARQLKPGDADVHWRLARLYQKMGKKEDAEAEFDRTRDLHKPDHKTVLEELHDTPRGTIPLAQ
jgi:tetratricopeptide (TPR) repeat protein